VKDTKSNFNKNPFEILQITSKAEEEVIKSAVENMKSETRCD